ncbi:dithiol-disulfide isomerase [Lactococcus nasutitermitis]|uniref:Dithiol-disulfide isomerase n=1 Tax=Lactococcus nasutitermitis TaxID=1652957 RepID=A0ABV9JFX3_9LACT|nr:dithiol-disulfide isomerase [Lactococcus nasutitermitis]
MFEIHYYFTPILDALETFDENDWHLCPVLTLVTAKALRDRLELPRNVENLNACYDRLQKISVDFLTVNLHGRKYGRQFLLKLQEKLAEPGILAYNDLLRHQILQEIGLRTSDFIIYRDFGKQELALVSQNFHKDNFKQSPAGLIMTDTEYLQLNKCDHHHLQNYLKNIEKTA